MILDGFTGEELRLRLLDNSCPAPHHHNAWGAFIMQATRLGIIRPTGQFRNMATPKSHARATRVYEWAPPMSDR